MEILQEIKKNCESNLGPNYKRFGETTSKATNDQLQSDAISYHSHKAIAMATARRRRRGRRRLELEDGQDDCDVEEAEEKCSAIASDQSIISEIGLENVTIYNTKKTQEERTRRRPEAQTRGRTRRRRRKEKSLSLSGRRNIESESWNEGGALKEMMISRARIRPFIRVLFLLAIAVLAACWQSSFTTATTTATTTTDTFTAQRGESKAVFELQKQQQKQQQYQRQREHDNHQRANSSISALELSESATNLSSCRRNETSGCRSDIGGQIGNATRPHELSKRAPSVMGVGIGATGQASRKQQQQQQYLLSRISEADLLPLSDFNIEQPAFSDIMKTWPASSGSGKQMVPANVADWPTSGGVSGPTTSTRSRHEQHGRRHHAPFGQRAPSSGGRHEPIGGSGSSFFDRFASFGSGVTNDDTGASLVRNHLNEDFDDSIVTADESFEQDQLAEPPTWVNYLGELGDFIYVLLRQFYEPSNVRSPFSNANRSAQIGSTMQQARFDSIEDLLDDFYYDQYENSQVLYYGPQLVREGETLEIGCYLPIGQPAEWTKSGKLLRLNGGADSSNAMNFSSDQSVPISMVTSPHVIRRTDFMGIKQNLSLKIFEAQLGDTGNYRCNRLSRKYHKLIVIPAGKMSSQQLYLIQQKLLSVVDPSQVSSEISSQQIQLAALHSSMQRANQLAISNLEPNQRSRQLTIQANGSSSPPVSGSAANDQVRQQRPSQTPSTSNQLLPGYVLVEGQPMIVSCNISDEFILRRLRENPQFQLAWFKNGKLLRNSQLAQGQNSTSNTYYTSSGLVKQVGIGSGAGRLPLGPQQQQQQHQQQNQQQHQRLSTGFGSQRIQFLGANGRQMYISAANYADAADYLCSWSRLPARQPTDELESDEQQENSNPSQNVASIGQRNPTPSQQLNANPLAAGNLLQLVAPVKLRPFKSAYHVHRGKQLRLFCQVQRGFPAAQISWYVGNQLVDADFLRRNPEFRLLQLESRSASPQSGTQRQFVLKSSLNMNQEPDSTSGQSGNNEAANEDELQIVEINPIPAGRQQMQLTEDGRGKWIEYRSSNSEKFSIDTAESQLKYLQMKFAQLTGSNQPISAPNSNSNSNVNSNANAPSMEPQVAAAAATAASQTSSSLLLNQASLSVLVISKLEQEKHTSRFACRATSRANTDEVTTLIRVKESVTLVMRPNDGSATLVPGQRLNFQCGQIGHPDAQFKWYKRNLPTIAGPNESNAGAELDQPEAVLLEPNTDDSIEIHNERLTLHKPGYDAIGDYECRALSEDKKEEEPKEVAVIKLRAKPYIEDLGIELSHTGDSATVTEGDPLILNCHVRDPTVPVNITWLRSRSASKEDLNRNMVALRDSPPGQPKWAGPPLTRIGPNPNDVLIPTYTLPDDLVVERVDFFTRRLIIESASQEHRGLYVCVVDNGVTERAQKLVYIRVKDKIVALWPFLGILAELFILFTIIYIWETQRAQAELSQGPAPGQTPNKRFPSGPSNAPENVPLNR